MHETARSGSVKSAPVSPEGKRCARQGWNDMPNSVLNTPADASHRARFRPRIRLPATSGPTALARPTVTRGYTERRITPDDCLSALFPDADASP